MYVYIFYETLSLITASCHVAMYRLILQEEVVNVSPAFLRNPFFSCYVE